MVSAFLRVCSVVTSFVLGSHTTAFADALDVGVPIVLQDEYSLDRDSELVAIPFPIAESAEIFSTGQLRVVNAAGLEIASQWQTLTRWRAKPNDASAPIRFALAHVRVSIRAGELHEYRVFRRQPGDPVAPSPQLAIKVTTTPDSIVVDTSEARFEIPTTGATLFRRVDVDLDQDGNYGSQLGETVVAPGTSFGPAMIDPFGGLYLGAIDPGAKATLEEVGPLRVVLKVEGAHQPIGPGTIGRDYLRFTTRYYFCARSPAVRVEHTLENNYLTNPLGAMRIGRYVLHTKLLPMGNLSVRYGRDEGMGSTTPLTLGLSAPYEARFYQDSSGGPNWSQPGTSFPGWRLHATLPSNILSETYPAAPTLASGARAAGWMDATSGSRGLFVSLRYPWQNHPYAFRTFYEGSLGIDLLPAEYAGNHWLDDGQKKTWDLLFVPHGADFDAATMSKRHQKPLRAVPPVLYTSNTLAWGDLGSLRVPKIPKQSMISRGNLELQIFYNTLDVKGSFGWSNFGEYTWAKSTHATGSPRNRLTWFDRFMTCGGDAWFERAEIFALHSMALRTYHLDGFVATEHPNAILGEGMPGWPGTDMLGRDSIPASLSPYKQGIPVGGSGWNGYDGEHMMVDDLYEYYLVTGSKDALLALERIGEGMLSWKHTIDSNKPIPSSRFIGWVLRAQIKIWQATGDERLLAQAAKLVAIAEKYRGKTPSDETGIVYHYLARSIYSLGSHNMVEDYDCPWQIGVGLYGFALYYNETHDPLALSISKQIGEYVAQYGTNGLVPVEAIECDDHNVVNPKPTNDGVNQWLSSSLAMSYAAGADPSLAVIAEKIFDDNKTGFLNAGDNYHWFHTSGIMFDKDP